jgi:hypothetical protein
MSYNNGRTHFREKKSGSKNDAVICAIALHEEPYIDEWIQYHIALGFSHIYLYDNSNDHILKNKNSDKIPPILITIYLSINNKYFLYYLFILKYVFLIDKWMP